MSAAKTGKPVLVLAPKEWWESLRRVFLDSGQATVAQIYDATRAYRNDPDSKPLRTTLLTRGGDEKRKRFVISVGGDHRAVGCRGHHGEIVWEWAGAVAAFGERYGPGTKAAGMPDTRILSDDFNQWLKHMPDTTPKVKAQPKPSAPKPQQAVVTTAQQGKDATFATIERLKAENLKLAGELEMGAKLLVKEAEARAKVNRENESLRKQLEAEKRRSGELDRALRQRPGAGQEAELARLLDEARTERNRLDTHVRELTATVTRQKARLDEEAARAKRAETLLSASQAERDSEDTRDLRAELEVTRRMLARREDEVLNLRLAIELARAGLPLPEPEPKVEEPTPQQTPQAPETTTPSTAQERTTEATAAAPEAPAPQSAPEPQAAPEPPAPEAPPAAHEPVVEKPSKKGWRPAVETRRILLERITNAGEKGVLTRTLAETAGRTMGGTLSVLSEMREAGLVRSVGHGRSGTRWYPAAEGAPTRQMSATSRTKQKDRKLTESEKKVIDLFESRKGQWVARSEIAAHIKAKEISVAPIISAIRALTGAEIISSKDAPDRPGFAAYKLM